MRNIDKNALELAFKLETGYYKESVPFRDYVEWLEEKVTKLLVTQEQFADIGTALRKREEEREKQTENMAKASWKPKITLCSPCVYYRMCHAECKDKERCVIFKGGIK